MEIQNEEEAMTMKKRRNKHLERRTRVSFSAELPDDVVCGALRDSCICAVKYSTNPFSDIRESIVEMTENVGIRDWSQMEDLVYCYISLNSSDLHNYIRDAFLSLRFDFLDSPAYDISLHVPPSL